MGWKLLVHKSTKTNGYAQDGNIEMNHHPPLPYQPFANGTKFCYHLSMCSPFHLHLQNLSSQPCNIFLGFMLQRNLLNAAMQSIKSLSSPQFSY